MGTLAALRTDVADTVAGVLDGAPVFDYWPSNIAAPCAVIALGAGQQDMAVRWATTWHVTLVGTSGDNAAAQQWVETTLVAAAKALSSRFDAPCSWDTPGRTTYAGQDYYVATLRIPLDLEA